MQKPKSSGIRIKSQVKSGITKDITTIYSECFNACYDKVLNNRNLTYDKCLTSCINADLGSVS